MNKNELIVGDFKVVPASEFGDISVRITGPSGNTIYDKINVNEGKFAFTSVDAGEHRICFTNTGTSTHRTNLLEPVSPFTLSFAIQDGSVLLQDWSEC